MIRTLCANEIETRVASTSKDFKWCNLLLYKTARTDYDLLDELFGIENWQSDYREVKGNMYCGIGVRARSINETADPHEWVWKWNAGVESKGTGEDDTNNIKGEASDAFKRAGFCWGIGRELYKWKDIWIELAESDFKTYGEKKVMKAKFEVRDISYTADGEPEYLSVFDDRGNLRFELGKRTKAPKSVDSETKANTPNKVAPEQEKLLGAPKNDVKTQSALTREDVVRRNAPAKKAVIVKGMEYIEAYADAKEAQLLVSTALGDYILNVLKLQFDTLEIREHGGAGGVTLDELTPDISGDRVLLVDDEFWNGNGKSKGFYKHLDEAVQSKIKKGETK